MVHPKLMDGVAPGQRCPGAVLFRQNAAIGGQAYHACCSGFLTKTCLTNGRT